MSDPLKDSPSSDSPKLAPIPPGPVKLPPLKLPPKPVLSGTATPGALKPPAPLVPPVTSSIPATPVPPVTPASGPKPAVLPSIQPEAKSSGSSSSLATPAVLPSDSTSTPTVKQAPKVAIKLQTTPPADPAFPISKARAASEPPSEVREERDLVLAIGAVVLALIALAVQLWTLVS